MASTAPPIATGSSIVSSDFGPLGAGSNMLRSGVAHSSGVVYLGTYGPPPAIIWKYDPRTPERGLIRVATPGEYQLDCMIEGPNGHIYIGTAYEGIVYELDPADDSIKNLGAPPVHSTTWIFNMHCTREGEIFGVRGVGLFHLDWRTGKMTSCGVVPGNHETFGVSSGPITRFLEERPDGLIWGDTNRWIFTFDPRTRVTTPVCDVGEIDKACYGVFHSLNPSPFNDLYFQIYARFNDLSPKHLFYRCRADNHKVEPLAITGLSQEGFIVGWCEIAGEPRMLFSEYLAETQRSSMVVLDVLKERIVDRWDVDGYDTPPMPMAARDTKFGKWFYSLSPGTLYRAEPEKRRMVAVATNPEPVECRCLAAAPDGRLGVDTYDCGSVFTYSPDTRKSEHHGRVYFDDHRANYGPAAFAGENGQYFVANHGEEARVASLWVTDTQNNRHWRLGTLAAVQLVRLSNGAVWGTAGANPRTVEGFDEPDHWISAWAARPGKLFRYQSGAKTIEVLEQFGDVGPIAEVPVTSIALPRVAITTGHEVKVIESSTLVAVQSFKLDFDVAAAASDVSRGRVYFVSQSGDGAVYEPRGASSLLEPTRRFILGPTSRGCFVLPISGRLVGLALDGGVSVFDPTTGESTRSPGPKPLLAGPAVDPKRDAWYFAHRTLTRYELK